MRIIMIHQDINTALTASRYSGTLRCWLAPFQAARHADNALLPPAPPRHDLDRSSQGPSHVVENRSEDLGLPVSSYTERDAVSVTHCVTNPSIAQ